MLLQLACCTDRATYRNDGSQISDGNQVRKVIAFDDPTAIPTGIPTPLPGDPTSTPSTASPTIIPTMTPSDMPTAAPTISTVTTFS